MQYPDLIWTAGGIIGGLLLIDSLSLAKKGTVGIWIIFASFIFQVYWEITHPWIMDISLFAIGITTFILVFGLLILMVSRFRRRKMTRHS